MSLAVKPKDADNAKSKASVAEDLSDSMPF